MADVGEAQPLSVLVNADTGLAESLPKTQADQALAQGTHEIPLVDPNGQHVTAPLAAARDLLAQGYRQPNLEQLKELTDYAKYSSTPEQIKTFLEGAGEAGTFGISTGLERALGAKSEDIQARREVNPGVHTLGQVAGLAGSAFVPEVGAANVLKGAGEAAVAGAAKIGLKVGEETLASRLTAQAIKNAAETALVQSGDEVSKMFASDPHQTLGTAITDVGLSGLLGGALGAGLGTVPEMWNAAKGSQTAKYLSALKAKVENRFGEQALKVPLESGERAGVTMDPEIKAALGNTPEAQHAFQDLIATPGTFASRNLQEKFTKFQDDLKQAALNAVGHTEESLTNLGAQSQAALGKQTQKIFSDEISKKFGPAIEKMEAFKTLHGKEEIPLQIKNDLEESIGKIIQDNRWHIHTDDPASKFASGILSKINKLETMQDLQDEMKYISSKYPVQELRFAAGRLKEPFRNAEGALYDSLIGKEPPVAMAGLQEARRQYGYASQLVDQFNDYLHVGKYIGPKSFLQAVSDMDPETFLNRLSNENRANLLEILNTTPETKKIIQSSHLSDALSGAVKNGEFNAKAFTKKIGSWSPELRKFALPEGADQKLAAIKTLYDRVPPLRNPSGTAGTLDKIMSQMPSGIMSVISMMMGHGPIWGFLSGQLMRLIGREAPDALKLATLKFLGSTEPMDAPAFKAAVDYIHATIKGESLVSKATKNVFEAGKDVLPTVAIPSDKKLDKLDKQVQNLQINPAPLLDVGGKSKHYLPEHGGAMGMMASNALNYLQSIRPTAQSMGPLGELNLPSQTEISQYKRQLAIAEQPLMILKHMQTGDLSPQDLTTFKTLYPQLADRISQKLMENVIERKSKGQLIPYKAKMSLSMLTGQDLDASLSQPFISFNQMTLAGHGAAQAASEIGQQMKVSQKGLSSINLAERLRTPMQSAALRERT